MAITLIITKLQPDDMRLLVEFVVYSAKFIIYLAKLLDKLLPITFNAYGYTIEVMKT